MGNRTSKDTLPNLDIKKNEYTEECIYNKVCEHYNE
jgi:hypothetical protein